MKKIVLLLGVFTACGVPQPSNEEVPAPPNADLAAELAVLTWSGLLDKDLAIADLPPVRWFAGECLEYGDDEPGCTVGGFSFSPFGDPEIHLIRRTTISESSLAHEVLHWALGDSDTADHATPEWDLVGSVKESLETAGY